MNSIIVRLAIIIFIACNLILPSIQATPRTALVIGNSQYQYAPLSNPENDALDIATKLRQLNFDVIHKNNVTRKQMKQAIREFGRKLRKKGGVGLFYYAGHGVQVKGANYLIPLNAEIEYEYEIPDEALSASSVLRAMESAENDMNIVILDACRDNPFQKSWRSTTNGLARMDAPIGSLVAFATAPGKKAADGQGRNGTYTHYLLKFMEDPKLTLNQVFMRVRSEVEKETKGTQTPWEESSLRTDFYFIEKQKQSDSDTNDNIQVNIVKNADISFWNSIKDSRNAAYFLAYLNRFGETGTYSEIAKIKRNEILAGLVKPIPKVAHLTVKTSPKNTQIRILNLVSKYQPGMSLNPGRYLIEVTHSGYQRHTEWLEVNKKNTVHSVILIEQQDNTHTTSNKKSTTVNVTPNDPTYLAQEIEMINIPKGCFQMGSNTGDNDEKKVHRVCLLAYSLGKYEITQAQWKKVMGNNPSFFKDDHKPVETVSWHDIQLFINKLNKQTQKNYRLPTEAEWEYGCRSGGKNQTYCGGEDKLNFAWYRDNSDKKTHQVGQRLPNQLGLYDMSGNVWEWVEDRYDSNYYNYCPVHNPKGPSTGSLRVFRGGSWSSDAHNQRAANRYGYNPNNRNRSLGFRLAISH